MFFPESLFLLSARDQQVTWLDPFFERSSLSTPAASLSLVFGQVPRDRALVLTNLVARCIPGAASNFLDGFIGILDPSINLRILKGSDPTPPAATRQGYISWSGQVLVPPLWQFQMDVNFSAVAPNGIEGFAIGMLVPVGNVQRV